MSLDETTDLNPNYIPLDEKENYEIKTDPSEKKKIGEVLIHLNSFSKKFQIKVLSILGFIYFVFGIHIFTFVYMFLSPEFSKPGNPSESKKSLSSNIPPQR